MRFERLAQSLETLAGQPQLAAMAKDAAADENRHAEQCCALVRYFGEEMTAREELVDRQVAPKGCTPTEGLLYEMVAMSCVTETLSCALLGALVERAADSRVKEEMHSILKDEIGHSRLGWAFLATGLSSDAKQFVAHHLPAMLRGTVTRELFEQRPPHQLEEPLSGLGALTRLERVDIFRESMQKVVFPGLERFGIDARLGADWLKQQLES